MDIPSGHSQFFEFPRRFSAFFDVSSMSNKKIVEIYVEIFLRISTLLDCQNLMGSQWI